MGLLGFEIGFIYSIYYSYEKRGNAKTLNKNFSLFEVSRHLPKSFL